MKAVAHLGRLLALPVFVLSLGAAPAATSPEDGYRSAGFHRAFEWRESAGPGLAEGLYLMDMVPAGMVQRVLAEGPGGRHVRLTRSLDVRRGIDTSELLDDATGWGARLEIDFGFQADTLGAFFAADEARSAEPEPRPLRVRFTAPDVEPVEIEVAAVEPEALHDAVARAVQSAAGKELAGRLPEGLAETILFLDASLSPDPLDTRSEGDNLAHALRGVVEVLADVVRAAPPEGVEVARYATPWTMTVQPIERGTSSSNPGVLEFVSRFRSVENADPLSDHAAAEVFAGPPPT